MPIDWQSHGLQFAHFSRLKVRHLLGHFQRRLGCHRANYARSGGLESGSVVMYEALLLDSADAASVKCRVDNL